MGNATQDMGDQSLDVNTQTQKKIFETDSFFGIPFLLFSVQMETLLPATVTLIKQFVYGMSAQVKKREGLKEIRSQSRRSLSVQIIKRLLVPVMMICSVFGWVNTGKERETVTGYGGAFAKV